MWSLCVLMTGRGNTLSMDIRIYSLQAVSILKHVIPFSTLLTKVFSKEWSRKPLLPMTPRVNLPEAASPQPPDAIPESIASQTQPTSVETTNTVWDEDAPNTPSYRDGDLWDRSSVSS